MKGPQGMLSEAIANALGAFFVVDEGAIETHLIQDAGITLHDIQLKEQTIPINSKTLAVVNGVVAKVSFRWAWGKEIASKGGSDWVKDAHLSLTGLDFSAVLSQDESVLMASGLATDETEGAIEKTVKEAKGLMKYIEEQVQGIIDTLQLSVNNFKFTLELPSGDPSSTEDGRSLVFGGQDLDIRSLGKSDGAPLRQDLSIGSIFVSVLVNGETLPLLDPLTYKASVERSFGKRFSGIDKGLQLTGESNDNGVVLHAGATQLIFLNELGGLLLSPKEQSESHDEPNTIEVSLNDAYGVDPEQDEMTGSHFEVVPDEEGESSYFEFSLAAISLVFPNGTKISLNNLVTKYQFDGQIFKIEGRKGISVNNFPLLALRETALWCTDLVNCSFTVMDPEEEEEASEEDVVAFIHARETDIDAISGGLNEVLSIYNTIVAEKTGVFATLGEEPPSTQEENQDDKRMPDWMFGLSGTLGTLWEGEDGTMNAEVFMRDIKAGTAPISLAIGSIEKLYMPDVCRLVQPIENPRIWYDKSIVHVELEKVIVKQEEKPEAPAKESVKEASSMVSNTSWSDKESLEHDSESKSEDEFILPFGAKASIEEVVIYKPDGEERHTTASNLRLALGPHTSDMGEPIGHFRAAIGADKIDSEMIFLTNPFVFAVINPKDLDTLTNFDFRADKITVTAGYSVLDWNRLIGRGDKKHRRRKKKKAKKVDTSTPFNLPYAHVAKLKVRVAVRSDLVGVKENTLHMREFNGNAKTTTEDLISFYGQGVVTNVPGMVTNAELFGTNVADAAATTYGSVIGSTAFASLGGAAMPVGGVVAVAAFDGVRNTLTAGKLSRKAEADDTWKPGDFIRGLGHVAVQATRDGAAMRGKTEDEGGDPIDWAVGATGDVANYANDNKSRLGAAGAGSVGFMAGMVLGGPIGAIAGAVVASVATGKTIETAENWVEKSSRSRAAKSSKKRTVSGDEGVEYSFGDMENKQRREREEDRSIETDIRDYPAPQRGVLLKRRDFFKWEWNSHYFVCDDEEGVLKYFLVSERPIKGNDELETDDLSEDEKQMMYVDDSQGPRKSLNLTGLFAETDDSLSKPSESLYVFTIKSPDQKDPLWVLAAASPRTRDIWVSRINQCRLILK